MRSVLEELVTIFSFESKGTGNLRNHEIALKKAARASKNFHQTLRNGIADVSRSNGALGLLTGGLIRYGAAAAGVFSAVRAATSGSDLSSEFEIAEISLTSLTKSQEKANGIIKEARQLWLKTGVEATDQIKNMKRFIALGFDDVKAKALNRSILDIAGSVGLSTDETKLLGSAIAQVQAKGVVQMEELRQQIAEKGVPAIQALMQETGLEGTAFFQAVKDGEVSSDQLIDLFINLNGEFEKFRGGADKLGNTFDGLKKRARAKFLLDMADGMRKFNEELKPLLREFIEFSPLVRDLAFGLGELLIVILRAVKSVIEFERNTKLLSGTLRILAISIGGLLILKNAIRLIWLFGTASGIAAVKAWFLNASILGIPLAVVLAIAALVLLSEELFKTFTGGDTVTRNFLNTWRQEWPKTFAVANAVWDSLRAVVALAVGAVLISFQGMISTITGDWESFDALWEGFMVTFEEISVGAINSIIKAFKALGGDVDAVKNKVKGLIATLENTKLGKGLDKLGIGPTTIGPIKTVTKFGTVPVLNGIDAATKSVDLKTTIPQTTGGETSFNDNRTIRVVAPEGVTDGKLFGEQLLRGLGTAFDNFDNAAIS